MKFKINNLNLKTLYIFFLIVALNNFFFSTGKTDIKAFDVENIELSQPFEIDFNKNDIINKGFRLAFSKLISLIAISKDRETVKNTKLNKIKGMIESFTIKEEKFIDQIYYVNLGVTFNKKKVFSYLENNNIFPTIPKKKNFLFLPIIIDETKKNLLLFSDNIIFEKWNENLNSYDLIDYVLPSEDLEDINLLKQNFEFIENYDFKDITKKYSLENTIIALIFKNSKEIKVLSKISIKDNIKLKNQSFINIDLKNKDHIMNLINQLKTLYEDHWKISNQINTSIKLPIKIMLKSKNEIKISEFERILDEMDLIYDFFIYKYEKNKIFYEIIFNGTPNVFLKNMKEENYSFDTQNKIWVLK